MALEKHLKRLSYCLFIAEHLGSIDVGKPAPRVARTCCLVLVERPTAAVIAPDAPGAPDASNRHQADASPLPHNPPSTALMRTDVRTASASTVTAFILRIAITGYVNCANARPQYDVQRNICLPVWLSGCLSACRSFLRSLLTAARRFSRHRF